MTKRSEKKMKTKRYHKRTDKASKTGKNNEYNNNIANAAATTTTII